MMEAMSIVTNMVMCFAITTTRPVPVACPDGIPGCCVAHYAITSETRYEPLKINAESRGIAIDNSVLTRAIENNYTECVTNQPAWIPIRLFGTPVDDKEEVCHPIGFINRDSFHKESAKFYYLDLPSVTTCGGFWCGHRDVTIKETSDKEVK